MVENILDYLRTKEVNKMTEEVDYTKKVWCVEFGRYSYDEKEVLTREEADKIASKKAAGNYELVKIWELVGTVQNKMPLDLVVTPIA